jgi:hypothetical protein
MECPLYVKIAFLLWHWLQVSQVEAQPEKNKKNSVVLSVGSLIGGGGCKKRGVIKKRAFFTPVIAAWRSWR